MTKLALVIGGASGIGAASARALAAAGHRIAVADLDGDGAAAVARALDGAGHSAHAADVADEPALVSLIDAVEREHGPVGILVIAAGVAGYVDGGRPSLSVMPTDMWDRVMAINVRGPMICIRELLRRRDAVRVADARIILIGSMAAQTLALNSPASYVASKGALHALARCAAGEGASLGVTVNVVAPGVIDTPMLRGVMPAERDAAYFGTSIAGRAGTSEEIAAAVVFLASPASAYINGAILDVNGGLLMR